MTGRYVIACRSVIRDTRSIGIIVYTFAVYMTINCTPYIYAKLSDHPIFAHKCRFEERHNSVKKLKKQFLSNGFQSEDFWLRIAEQNFGNFRGFFRHPRLSAKSSGFLVNTSVSQSAEPRNGFWKNLQRIMFLP